MEEFLVLKPKQDRKLDQSSSEKCRSRFQILLDVTNMLARPRYCLSRPWARVAPSSACTFTSIKLSQ